ncbi:hypothetical protein Lcho_0455 [Leptothrix cholodnii SP-6]|uniref:Uncharacterized protein n=1 Tax=Leptothrix cholodnii (strain ATCC 51168 / LMG 8142 / SP-6) TaxID=395495 RepID=B1XXW1_LEPCP|nr:hypothetical protein [Leptothrix cholodnii]ACB32730.1 hypothetical protein Lcho_0455 [Leptothrix cholodnii SP-6]
MKYLLRNDHQAPRRPPVPERSTDKGQKHESFDFGRIGFDQRSMALAQRMDRKR